MKHLLRTLPAAALLALFILLIGSACTRESPVCPAPDATAAEALKAAAPTFAVTFDRQDNEGDWSFFGTPDNRVEVIERTGGNPGSFLHATCGQFGCLDTYAPKFHTLLGGTSVFTGDYRTRGVTRLGVDFAIFGPEILTTLGRPLSLILSNDRGTPDNSLDDLQIIYVGKTNIPTANGNWRSYSFKVPADSETLPDGWALRLGSGSGDADADWNTVITDVTRVEFFYGDPDYYFMYQQWELGADNPSITFVGD